MPDQELLWKKHYPDFVACEDPCIRQLRDTARLLCIPAYATVFRPGSACTNYLLLTDGTVRVQVVTASGREILLYRLNRGRSCTLTTSCLLGGNDYPAEGVAETAVNAFAIPTSSFHRAMDQSRFFRGFVFADFAQRLGRVITRMEELVTGDLDAAGQGTFGLP